MKILFALSSPEFLRFYDDTIAELARRGHNLVVGVQTVREGKPVRLGHIEGVHEDVTVAGIIPARRGFWVPLARAIRGTMDAVRYLHPRLAPAAALRTRVMRLALPWPLQPIDRITSIGEDAVARVMQLLARLERAVPVAPETSWFLQAHQPDLVLVSPLVEMASDQVDVVRSAQALGVRVGTLVASWDNLTNKGDLRVSTDRVFVWNEAQRREAVELHRVEASRVVVTGAPVYDRWFGREPTRTRGEFCRDVGLPNAEPFVLFTGSSIFIARPETEIPFVRRWIKALRASGDPGVRRLGVLVRPHPYNGRAWPQEAFADLESVAVWPSGGYDPVDEGNRAGFFDSMFHAEAVVGINTSAMIESAVVGRPVLSILAPEFAATQGGTLHFHHLLPENGGFLRVARTLDEHVRQLGDVIANPTAARAGAARFVAAFVRPLGIAHPATQALVDALETLGNAPAHAPVGRTTSDRVWAAALLPLAYAARWWPPEAAGKGPVRRAIHSIGPKTRKAGQSARKRFLHTVRLARYHAAVTARRLRGVPIE